MSETNGVSPNGFHTHGEPDPPVVRGWPLRLAWDVVPLSQAVAEIAAAHEIGDEDDHHDRGRVRARLLERGWSVATKHGAAYTLASRWPGYPVRRFAVLAWVAERAWWGGGEATSVARRPRARGIREGP